MIFWLASYPKSGNTWIRSLISTYENNETNDNVFLNLRTIKKFPNTSQFKDLLNFDLLKENKLEDKLEICKKWILAQEKLNKISNFTILKTHNFGGSYNGSWFTDEKNTCGFIYIVRDPRSVAVSSSNYENTSIEQSVKNILNENLTATNPGNLLEIRSSWKNHYLSWKRRNFSKMIVRYEDLHNDTFNCFKKILDFLKKFKNINIDENKILETIKICSFENLSLLENQKGFEEKFKGRKFFREGRVDEWKNKLNKNLIKKIENNFYEEMKELKYL
jgi:hypothetical protein